MARGWESKAVADQIEQGSPPRPGQAQSFRSPDERQKQERLASLLLSKSRVLQQLERVTHPDRRAGLLKGLQSIELEIGEVTKQLADPTIETPEPNP